MRTFQENKYFISLSPEEACNKLRLEENLRQDMEAVVLDVNRIIEPIGGFCIYDQIKMEYDRVWVNETKLLCHHKICRLLDGSTSLAVLVCTLGNGVSLLYNEYNSHYDFVKSYLCDRLANLLIENAVSGIKKEIIAIAQQEGLWTTSHLSPGYCDWDIEEQRLLFSLLPNDPCSISLTSSCLMQPMKSVSAIMGLGKQVIYKESNCSLCQLKNCSYRKVLSY